MVSSEGEFQLRDEQKERRCPAWPELEPSREACTGFQQMWKTFPVPTYCKSVSYDRPRAERGPLMSTSFHGPQNLVPPGSAGDNVVTTTVTIPLEPLSGKTNPPPSSASFHRSRRSPRWPAFWLLVVFARGVDARAIYHFVPKRSNKIVRPSGARSLTLTLRAALG